MGEGFKPRGPPPSPIIICGNASLPSPAGGESAITGAATRGAVLSEFMKRIRLTPPVVRPAQRAIDRLGRQRQRSEPHPDCVLDRIGDRRRNRERAAFADAFAAEGTR